LSSVQGSTPVHASLLRAALLLNLSHGFVLLLGQPSIANFVLGN
jgi:hypothetical protein